MSTPESAPASVHRVTVVGAGAMGAQIAHQFALHGMPVMLTSRSADRLRSACGGCASLLRRRVEKGKLAAEACEDALARVTVGTDLAAAVADADLVVESVVEDRDAKAEVFRAISRHAPERALLATNSSTLASSQFAGCVEHPERLLNMHFFNPPLTMRLVEVVRGPHTGAAAVAAAMDVVRHIDRTPVLVEKETYGFIANRILFAGLQEAYRLADGGFVSMEDCDLAVHNALGWPMGPFELTDLIGLDVTQAILDEGWKQTGDPGWRAPDSLRDRVARGETGRKAGRGFRVRP